MTRLIYSAAILAAWLIPIANAFASDNELSETEKQAGWKDFFRRAMWCYKTTDTGFGTRTSNY